MSRGGNGAFVEYTMSGIRVQIATGGGGAGGSVIIGGQPGTGGRIAQ